jgi:hypothetical protein
MTNPEFWAGQRYRPRRSAANPIHASVWNNPPSDPETADISAQPGEVPEEAQIEYRMT